MSIEPQSPIHTESPSWTQSPNTSEALVGELSQLLKKINDGSGNKKVKRDFKKSLLSLSPEQLNTKPIQNLSYSFIVNALKEGHRFIQLTKDIGTPKHPIDFITAINDSNKKIPTPNKFTRHLETSTHPKHYSSNKSKQFILVAESGYTVNGYGLHLLDRIEMAEQIMTVYKESPMDKRFSALLGQFTTEEPSLASYFKRLRKEIETSLVTFNALLLSIYDTLHPNHEILAKEPFQTVLKDPSISIKEIETQHFKALNKLQKEAIQFYEKQEDQKNQNLAEILNDQHGILI
jgi:hypothetical protein